jgi:hypothetical protein
MTPLDLIPTPYRGFAASGFIIAACGIAALLSWQAQDWRYGQLLEHQARLHADTLNEIVLAAAAVQRSEQTKRLALEQRLQVSDQAHYSELIDAQKRQKRLLNSLATSDLRLSVLLAATDSGSCSVSAAPGTSGLDHGARRAELEPAHAQRIIGITDDGDRGLIALKACQAYAKEVSSSK